MISHSIQSISPRTGKVYQEVVAQYSQSKREFARWLSPNHVTVVAKHAAKLSIKHKANDELVIVGALLHDYGDVWLDRSDNQYQQKTNVETTSVLQNAGFNQEEIREITQSIIAPHSCYPSNVPTTLEGKILATADAIAHLTTDIYAELQKRGHPKEFTPQQFSDWVSKKLDRDYNDKIFFKATKDEMRPYYLKLKKQFNQ